MYYTTPPASPYSPSSPPATPNSAVPLLLQPANRSSKSPSRSSSFHYPSSSPPSTRGGRPLSPLEPMPPFDSNYHPHPPRGTNQPPPPPPLTIVRANSTVPSFYVREDLSFPAPPPAVPPPPVPLTLAGPPFKHQRIGSSVPRYALEDVVVRNELPTLEYDPRGSSDHSSMTYYEGEEEPQLEKRYRGTKRDGPGEGGGGGGGGAAGGGKLVVNKEGFLEHEVQPVRGFWSRWFRGMVILLVFLAIITGVAIGVSEYYDSKHRREGDSSSPGQEGQGDSSASSSGITSSNLGGINSTLVSLTGSTTLNVIGDSSLSPSSLRMRTTIRTIATQTSSSVDRTSTIAMATTSHGGSVTQSDTTSDAPSPTQHGGSSSPSTDQDPVETSTDDSEDDTSTTDLDTSTDSPESTGRLFGLATASPKRRK